MQIRELLASEDWKRVKIVFVEILKDCYIKLGQAKTFEEVIRQQGRIEAVRDILNMQAWSGTKDLPHERQIKSAEDIVKTVNNALTKAAEETYDDRKRPD